MKGGDYYESSRYDTGGNGGILSEGVPEYRSAIEQARGPRTVQRVYNLLSRVDAVKDKYATGGIRQQLAREGARTGRMNTTERGSLVLNVPDFPRTPKYLPLLVLNKGSNMNKGGSRNMKIVFIVILVLWLLLG
jgi:hypothetical protein